MVMGLISRNYFEQVEVILKNYDFLIRTFLCLNSFSCTTEKYIFFNNLRYHSHFMIFFVFFRLPIFIFFDF